MIENTLENKAKFFAQYWGQKVVKLEVGKGIIGEYTIGYDNQFTALCEKLGFKNAFLELTPIENIRDEDAIALIKMYCEPRACGDFNLLTYKDLVTHGRNLCSMVFNKDYRNITGRGTRFWRDIQSFTSDATDYLRSKGYALKWIDISVETLIDYGWVKLKEVQDD